MAISEDQLNEFMQMREHVLKRPGMYWGSGDGWLTDVLSLLFDKSAEEKFSVRLSGSRIQILKSKNVDLYFGSGKGFFVPTYSSNRKSAIEYYVLGLLLLGCKRWELNCILDGENNVRLMFDGDKLLKTTSNISGFYLDLEVDELIAGFLNLSSYCLKNNIRNWLVFHPKLQTELFINESTLPEVLAEPEGPRIIFDGLSRIVSLYSPPLRGKATDGTAEVELMVGIHDKFDSHVVSYVNGRRQLYEQGRQVRILDTAIKKKLKHVRVKGSYIALIVVSMPEDEVLYESPSRYCNLGNENVFRLIEKIVEEELFDTVDLNTHPFQKIVMP